MSTLHTVNTSPFATGALVSCLRHCKPGDAILLIEDGVYGAIGGTDLGGQVKSALNGVSLYVLKGDASARGIDSGKFLEEVRSVGYDGFVDLVTEHDRTQAWL